MSINRFFLIFGLLISIPAIRLTAEDAKECIEIRPDRVNIYPQRMDLTGQETLLDVLRMYPYLMESGFDSQIDIFDLRMDNSPMNGNNRLLLSQIKAIQVDKIQICYNTGVAKGTIGLGGVIDINMVRFDKGIHGFAEAEAGTERLLGTSAELLLGSDNTDLFINASYSNDDFLNHGGQQYLTAHMTNRFSPHDRLLTYITEQVTDINSADNQKYMARARYFHDFNDIGTELLLVAGYQYFDDKRVGTPSKSTLGIVELNTPLFSRNLNMMLGWEGDFNKNDYRLSNNDIYLQFDYHSGPWRLTLGDRIMYYRFTPSSDLNKSIHEDLRNNMLASVIYTPGKGHQFQAGYYRKYLNPSYSAINSQVQNLSFDEWILYRKEIKEQNIQEMRLAYTYVASPNFNVSLSGNHFIMEQNDNFSRISISSFLKSGIFSSTFGVNGYCSTVTSYATFHVAPVIQITGNWMIAAQAVFFTNNAPEAQNGKTYGSLKIQKVMKDKLRVYGQWHDIFKRESSAALLGITYYY